MNPREKISYLLWKIQMSPNRDIFRKSSSDLLQLDVQLAKETLEGVLFNADYPTEIRLESAEFLGRMGDVAVYNQILSFFLTEEYPYRGLMARALALFKNHHAVPHFIEVYKLSQGDWHLRLDIIEALGQVPSPKSLSFLSQIFNEELPSLKEEAQRDKALYEQTKKAAASALSTLMTP